MVHTVRSPPGNGIQMTWSKRSGVQVPDARRWARKQFERSEMQSKDNDTIYEKYYRGVPTEQVSRLKGFRSTHPYKQLVIDCITWQYTSGGAGEKPLLVLSGGLGIGESAAFVFATLEDEYRVVSPSYPLQQGLLDILLWKGRPDVLRPVSGRAAWLPSKSPFLTMKIEAKICLWRPQKFMRAMEFTTSPFPSFTGSRFSFLPGNG